LRGLVACGVLAASALGPRAFAEPPVGAPPEGRRSVPVTSERARRCPSDMVLTKTVCVDRYESTMTDKATGEPLSPYYPPQPRLLRETFQAWELDRGAFGS